MYPRNKSTVSKTVSKEQILEMVANLRGNADALREMAKDLGLTEVDRSVLYVVSKIADKAESDLMKSVGAEPQAAPASYSRQGQRTNPAYNQRQSAPAPRAQYTAPRNQTPASDDPYPNRGKRWGDDELELISTFVGSNRLDPVRAGQRLGRTPYSVAYKAMHEFGYGDADWVESFRHVG